MGTIYLADNMEILPTLEDQSIHLIYIDPPFNTGKVQRRTQLRTVQDEEAGDRTGFQGRRYKTERGATRAYQDSFDDFLGFIEPRLREAHRLLRPDGSLFVHLDYREVHYCKVLLDQIFGRDCFVNEIIWAYDFGGRSKKKWSAKHDNILWYVKDPKSYTFHFDEMDRIPYMAPGLVGKKKAARGKTPTACWWHTIVPTNGKEKTGYPTQKPLGILDRIIKVHTSPGDVVLDFFAGSGTTGEAAARHERDFILIDQNQEAVDVMMERLAFASPTLILPDESQESPPQTTPKAKAAKKTTKTKKTTKQATKKATKKTTKTKKTGTKKASAKKASAKKASGAKKSAATKTTKAAKTAKKTKASGAKQGATAKKTPAKKVKSR